MPLHMQPSTYAVAHNRHVLHKVDATYSAWGTAQAGRAVVLATSAVRVG